MSEPTTTPTTKSTRINHRTQQLRVTMVINEGDTDPLIIWLQGGKGLRLSELMSVTDMLVKANHKEGK